MKISLKSILILTIQLSLFCQADKKIFPKALSFTPTKKTGLTYVQSSPKQKPKQRTKRHVQSQAEARTNLLKKIYFNSVSTVLLCPNYYEFKRIYDALNKGKIELTPYPEDCINEVYGTNDTQNIIDLKEQGLKPMYLFAINYKNVCLALCGQRTEEVMSFLYQFTPLFKNLKTILLYGICGCTNGDSVPGSILLSNTYYRPCNGTLGEKKGNTMLTLTKEKTHFVYIKEITTETEFTSFTQDLFTFIKEKGISVDLCSNFTSDLFINDPTTKSTLNETLQTNTVCINMEDFLIANFFKEKKPKVLFCPIRAVSDHAGGSTLKISESTKETACKALEKILPITLNFLDSQ